jgi:hypothetical protein
MYYAVKIIQAAGLAVILIDYARHFPELMDRRVLGAGIALFICGWAVQKLFLKEAS